MIGPAGLSNEWAEGEWSPKERLLGRHRSDAHFKIFRR
jgi:hypothetical protein